MKPVLASICIIAYVASFHMGFLCLQVLYYKQEFKSIKECLEEGTVDTMGTVLTIERIIITITAITMGLDTITMVLAIITMVSVIITMVSVIITMVSVIITMVSVIITMVSVIITMVSVISLLLFLNLDSNYHRVISQPNQDIHHKFNRVTPHKLHTLLNHLGIIQLILIHLLV